MNLLSKQVSFKKAAELFGVPESWLRQHSPVLGDVLSVGQALEAARGFVRDDADDHRRLRRLRAER